MPATGEGISAAVRDAATIIVHRNGSNGAEILMGQRGASAAFMPNKVVFPGGAVDPGDNDVPLAKRPDHICMDRLRENTTTSTPEALIAAAIRELWEETGLILGESGCWRNPPPDWRAFAATGHLASGAGLKFVFRAITPVGRPRRFDARFFTVHADRIRGDCDDFSRACDELSNLQWITLGDARQSDLPFITQVVLAEVSHGLNSDAPPQTVPFFRNDDESSVFQRLGAPLQPS